MKGQMREADAAFCENVRRLRTTRGLGLRDVAASAGIGHTILFRIEHGQPPLLAHAVAVAAALGVPLASLLGPPLCGTCAGKPPAGFACLTCGTSVPDAKSAATGEVA